MEEPKLILNEQDIFELLPWMDSEVACSSVMLRPEYHTNPAIQRFYQAKLQPFRESLESWLSESYPHTPNPVLQKRLRRAVISSPACQFRIPHDEAELSGFEELINQDNSFEEFYSGLAQKLDELIKKSADELREIREDRNKKLYQACAKKLLEESLVQVSGRDAEEIDSEQGLDAFEKAVALKFEARVYRAYAKLKERARQVKEGKALETPGYYRLFAELIKDSYHHYGFYKKAPSTRVGSKKGLEAYIKRLERLCSQKEIEQIVNDAKKHLAQDYITFLQSDFRKKYRLDDTPFSQLQDGTFRVLQHIKSLREHWMYTATAILDARQQELSRRLLNICIDESRAEVDRIVREAVDDLRHNIPAILPDLFNDAFSQELERWGVIRKKGDSYSWKPKRLRELKQLKRKKGEDCLIVSLNALAIDSKALEEKRVYVYTPDLQKKVEGIRLDPYSISEMFLSDLLKTMPAYAGNERQRDALALAMEIITGKSLPQEKAFMQALCKDNKVFFSNLLAEIKSRGGGSLPSPDFNVYDHRNARDYMEIGRFEPRLWNEKSALYLLYHNTIVSELIGILGSAGREHEKVYRNFETVWSRFNPRKFDLTACFEKEDLHDSYALSLATDAKKLIRAVDVSGSCLFGEDVKQIIDEPGTLNLLIKADSRSQGYARIFMAQTNRNESVMLVDTIELNHKMLEDAVDVLKAAGLALIQLGLDMNIKYVIGDEGRMKYIKEGFSNKEMKTSLLKLGSSPYWAYSSEINTESFVKTECCVLMQNWRV